jgi:hypothetical protein
LTTTDAPDNGLLIIRRALTLSVAAPAMTGVRRPAAGALPRSALLLRDLPPPRS